jgi:hypothetical protein
VTLRAGGLTYDRGGDATSLLIGADGEWQLNRHIIAEVGATWSGADASYLDATSNPGSPVHKQTATQLITMTAGVQAQALIGRVRPYLGLAAGLFVRYDKQASGERFVNSTLAVPGGVRVDVADRLGLRAEVRLRFDTHQDGGSAVNLEQTLGFTFTL